MHTFLFLTSIVSHLTAAAAAAAAACGVDGDAETLGFLCVHIPVK